MNNNRDISDRSPIRLWETSNEYQRVWKLVQETTKVDSLSCYNLFQLSKSVIKLPGDLAEAGVYKGGSARLLAEVALNTGKQIHLFDTFCGMPEVDPAIDIFQKGSFGDTTLDGVKEYLKSYPLIQFHAGFFPDTTHDLPSDLRFCFVHADMDIYQSTVDVCKFFIPRLVRGGMILFDDYGFRKCPGAKVAVDEYCGFHQLHPIYFPSGQYLIINSQGNESTEL